MWMVLRLGQSLEEAVKSWDPAKDPNVEVRRLWPAFSGL